MVIAVAGRAALHSHSHAHAHAPASAPAAQAQPYALQLALHGVQVPPPLSARSVVSLAEGDAAALLPSYLRPTQAFSHSVAATVSKLRSLHQRDDQVDFRALAFRERRERFTKREEKRAAQLAEQRMRPRKTAPLPLVVGPPAGVASGASAAADSIVHWSAAEASSAAAEHSTDESNASALEAVRLSFIYPSVSARALREQSQRSRSSAGHNVSNASAGSAASGSRSQSSPRERLTPRGAPLTAAERLLRVSCDTAARIVHRRTSLSELSGRNASFTSASETELSLRSEGSAATCSRASIGSATRASAGAAVRAGARVSLEAGPNTSAELSFGSPASGSSSAGAAGTSTSTNASTGTEVRTEASAHPLTASPADKRASGGNNKADLRVLLVTLQQSVAGIEQALQQQQQQHETQAQAPAHVHAHAQQQVAGSTSMKESSPDIDLPTAGMPSLDVSCVESDVHLAAVPASTAAPEQSTSGRESASGDDGAPASVQPALSRSVSQQQLSLVSTATSAPLSPSSAMCDATPSTDITRLSTASPPAAADVRDTFGARLSLPEVPLSPETLAEACAELRGMLERAVKDGGSAMSAAFGRCELLVQRFTALQHRRADAGLLAQLRVLCTRLRAFEGVCARDSSAQVVGLCERRAAADIGQLLGRVEMLAALMRTASATHVEACEL